MIWIGVYFSASLCVFKMTISYFVKKAGCPPIEQPAVFIIAPLRCEASSFYLMLCRKPHMK